MPTPKLSPYKRNAILKCKHDHPTWTNLQIANKCQVSEGKVSGVLKESPSEQVHEVTGNTCSISMPKTQIYTLDEMIAHCKIDLSIWSVERFVCNKWDMVYVDADGPQSAPQFQLKVWLVKKKEVAAARRELEDMKAMWSKEAPRPKAISRPIPSSGNMLEMNIPDLHVGKLAWAPESGANYDSEIAVQNFVEARDTLLERVKGHQFDEVVFVVGNDLLHSDNTAGTTTAGTRLDTDSRYHKTFRTVRTLMIDTIEILRKVARVKVIMVSGNHDNLSVWHLGDSLECYFHKYDDVAIDNRPRARKYHRFGQVMLMFTHGDKGKRQTYPLLMATEEPEMFGATKFREAHTGHLHMTKLDEQHGVRVRVLPALCEADAWHAENGFIGNLRNAEAYIWNESEGLIGTAIFSLNGKPEI